MSILELGLLLLIVVLIFNVINLRRRISSLEIVSRRRKKIIIELHQRVKVLLTLADNHDEFINAAKTVILPLLRRGSKDGNVTTLPRRNGDES